METASSRRRAREDHDDGLVPSDETHLQKALLSIYARLGVIEGKVNLVARAEAPKLLVELEKTVRRKPLIGQLYLLLDGKTTQKELVEKLASFGITTSEATVSRTIAKMEAEHGIVDLVQGGAAKIYRRDREMEKVLNLSQRIREWLARGTQILPEQQKRRAKKSN